MTLNRFRKCKDIFILVIVITFIEFLSPAYLNSITNGPISPEFANFTSVNTNNMVNEFTGSFTYNIPVLTIPGPDGSGYSLSLSYNSGIKPDEEASWVGWGWTLNPGVIIHQVRGIPDDFNGTQKVTTYNQAKPLVNASLTQRFRYEAWSDISLGISSTYNYNNYSGITHLWGMDAGYTYGCANANASMTHNTNTGGTDFGFSASVNLWEAYHDLSVNNPPVGPPEPPLQRSKDDLFAKSERAGASFSFSNIGDMNRSFPVTPSGLKTGTEWIIKPNLILAFSIITLCGAGIQLDPNSFLIHKRTQEFLPSKTESVCGYMYTYDGYKGNNNSQSKLDYKVEKEATFSIRDKYIGIPVAGYDSYILHGEGLQGGFRLFSQKPLYFRPPAMESNAKTIQTDLTGTIAPGGFGLGIDAGYGNHMTKLTPMIDDPYGKDYNYNLNSENMFFKFNNECSDELSYLSINDKGKLSVLSDNKEDLQIPKYSTQSPFVKTSLSDRRINRSNYIGYNLYHSKLEDDRFYYDYDNTTNSRRLSNDCEGLVREFAITNPQGSQYIYGLPLLAKNEKNISVVYKTLNIDNFKELDAENTKDKYLVIVTKEPQKNPLENPNDPMDPNSPKANIPQGNILYKTGTENNNPYVSMYLLTQINTPDYRDIGNDGPDVKDIGGYTKFKYRDLAGDNNWMFWRIPRSGEIYSRNSLSDVADDYCSYSSGERQVKYLYSIETKTHIAYFITNKTNEIVVDNKGKSVNLKGSQNARADGFDAEGKNKAEYLEKIELWSKDEHGKLVKKIQTTNFEYDSSLCKGIYKYESGEYHKGENKSIGKLTLKRVWFDYEDVVKDEISPYTFEYKYPINSTPPYRGDKWATMPTLKTNYIGLIENPDYQLCQADRWGSYQNNGVQKYNDDKPWVSQKNDADFDPAAWHLKQIILPSGGELHVQYEQNEYANVQDRPAMVMTSLLGGDTVKPLNDKMNTEIDVSEMMNALDDEYLESIYPGYKDYDIGDKKDTKYTYIVDEMSKYFITQGKFMYFKIVFGLDKTSSNIKKEHSNCEYVDGFIKVDNVSYVPKSNKIMIKIDKKQLGDIVENYYQNNRYSMFKGEDDIGYKANPSKAQVNYEDIEKDNRNTTDELWGAVWKTIGGEPDLHYIPSESYFRLPLPKGVAKKGGGVRVKRLLTYEPDNMRENIDESIPARPKALPNIYGTEYLYQLEDGTTSGVASNEPKEGWDENALMELYEGKIPKTGHQNFISGKDYQQFKGPLGEAFLPAASVGYSRVVKKSIYDGVNNSGIVVSDYYTTKDFPFDKTYNESDKAKTYLARNSDNTPINQWSEVSEKLETVLKLLSVCGSSYDRKRQLAKQGYSFYLNSMNGRPKSIQTYTGQYSEPLKWNLSKKMNYEYYLPGEQIPVFTDPKDGIQYRYLGQDMDVVNDNRKLEDFGYRASEDFDLLWSWEVAFLPIPIPKIRIPSVSITDYELQFQSMSKVVSWPVFVKSTSSYENGITNKVENIAFSPNTGEPVMQRQTDEFDNNIYSTKIKASEYYNSLGPKSSAERMKFTNGQVDLIHNDDGYFIYFEWKFSHIEKTFVPGDLLRVTVNCITSPNDVPQYYRVTEVLPNKLKMTPLDRLVPTEDDETYLRKEPDYKIQNIDCEIIRSGKANKLDLDVSNIAQYAKKDDEKITDTRKLFENKTTDNSETAVHKKFVECLNKAIESEPVLRSLIQDANNYTNTNNHYKIPKTVWNILGLTPTSAMVNDEIHFTDVNNQLHIETLGSLLKKITITQEQYNPSGEPSLTNYSPLSTGYPPLTIGSVTYRGSASASSPFINVEELLKALIQKPYVPKYVYDAIQLWNRTNVASYRAPYFDLTWLTYDGFEKDKYPNLPQGATAPTAAQFPNDHPEHCYKVVFDASLGMYDVKAGSQLPSSTLSASYINGIVSSANNSLDLLSNYDLLDGKGLSDFIVKDNASGTLDEINKIIIAYFKMLIGNNIIRLTTLQIPRIQLGLKYELTPDKLTDKFSNDYRYIHLLLDNKSATLYDIIKNNLVAIGTDDKILNQIKNLYESQDNGIDKKLTVIYDIVSQKLILAKIPISVGPDVVRFDKKFVNNQLFYNTIKQLLLNKEILSSKEFAYKRNCPFIDANNLQSNNGEWVSCNVNATPIWSYGGGTTPYKSDLDSYFNGSKKYTDLVAKYVAGSGNNIEFKKILLPGDIICTRSIIESDCMTSMSPQPYIIDHCHCACQHQDNIYPHESRPPFDMTNFPFGWLRLKDGDPYSTWENKHGKMVLNHYQHRDVRLPVVPPPAPPASISNYLTYMDGTITKPFYYSPCLKNGWEGLNNTIKYNPSNAVFEIEFGIPYYYTDISEDEYTEELKYDTITVNNNYLMMAKNVLDIQAVELSDEWDYNLADYGYGSATKDYYDPYTTGKRGIWRVKNNSVYNTPVFKGGGLTNSNDERIHKLISKDVFAGTYSVERKDDTGTPMISNQVQIYDWNNPLKTQSDKEWIKLSEITKYNPNGGVLEEVNNTGIVSAVKYGYNNKLPILIAKNADYNSVFFESFEDKSTSSGITIKDNVAHTGNKSQMIASGTSCKLSFNLADEDWIQCNPVHIIQLWARWDDLKSKTEYPNIELQLKNSFSTSVSPLDYSTTFTSVAQSGEWAMYEARVLPPIGFKGYTISISVPANQADVLIDDIRVLPEEAEMISYVYDPNTLKLLATLDAQHFAQVFQYNAEGQLVRKIKETYLGFKTIAEAQYNSPKEDRVPYGSSSNPVAPKINSNPNSNPTNINSRTYNSNNDTDKNEYDEEEPKVMEQKANINVLDINISPDGVKIDALNIKKGLDDIKETGSKLGGSIDSVGINGYDVVKPEALNGKKELDNLLNDVKDAKSKYDSTDSQIKNSKKSIKKELDEQIQKKKQSGMESIENVQTPSIKLDKDAIKSQIEDMKKDSTLKKNALKKVKSQNVEVNKSVRK